MLEVVRPTESRFVPAAASNLPQPRWGRLLGVVLLAGATGLAAAPAAAQDASLSAFQEFFDSPSEVDGEAFGGLRLRGLESTEASRFTYTSPDFGRLPGGPGLLSERQAGTGDPVFTEDGADGGDNAGFSLGYGTEFDGLGLEAAVVGTYPAADVEPEKQAYGIGGGLAVSFAGFTLAGGAVWDEADGNGGQDWRTDLGIAYGEGPWRFSLSGIYYTADGDPGDTQLGSAADIRYNLATGVSLFAIGTLGREEGGADGDEDVVTISSGIRLSF